MAPGHHRTVPIPPVLVGMLRAHLAAPYGKAPDGRVFTGVRGGELPNITCRRVWARARAAALTEAGYASPLAKRVYDLRHACVSTWRNDFNNCIPGELVRLASVCDRDDGDPDGRCGCARSFAGFVSAKATTTAIVAETDMTRDAYILDFARSYGLVPDTGVDEEIVAAADQLIALAAGLPSARSSRSAEKSSQFAASSPTGPAEET